MGKGGRQWLRPGDLNEYERERIKRIKENNDKVNSLQLKNIAAVFRSVQPKHASEKGKRKRVDVDDDDYMQPNSKDHSDDEFSDSFEHEVTNMPPTRRQLFNRESSSSVDICPQSNPPTEVNVEAQASLTTSASIEMCPVDQLEIGNGGGGGREVWVAGKIGPDGEGKRVCGGEG
ncbi:hypothetical protein U1Q18_047126 [Sarracenia purpurea var. burkii]